MDKIEVYKFLESNKGYLFPNTKYTDEQIENALITAPEEFEKVLQKVKFKNPKLTRMIGILLGGILGVDRFYLGDIPMGIVKYFTFGGLGIIWITDILKLPNRCREMNCQKIVELIDNPSAINDQTNLNSLLVTASNNISQTFTDIKKRIKDIFSTKV